jgi:hypothetical protein
MSMNGTGPQLSNPFSTGGGGGRFEAQVQALFALLMAVGGFAPGLPCWPIEKIRLQGKFAGYDTDDMIIFVQNDGGTQQCKMLCQIKHAMRISASDRVFSDVIGAAWRDFNDVAVFSKGKDAIGVVTGPLSAEDNEARIILEWSRHVETADELQEKIQLLPRFASDAKRKKFQAFQANLKKANSNTDVPAADVFEFLRHFHLLSCDLDVESGIVLSLLHSLIGQYSDDKIRALWALLVIHVQTVNQNAGILTPESLPDELKEAFKQLRYETIPKDYAGGQLPLVRSEWSHYQYAAELAIANLLGGWDENTNGDIAIVEKMAKQKYSRWILKIREVLLLSESPLELKDGRWSIIDRGAIWDALASRIFDGDLDILRQSAVNVLTEHDPQFELRPDDRITASLRGKTLTRSNYLRRGLAETLALLSSKPDVLTNCTRNKPVTMTKRAIREILDDGSWVLWASLDDLLPLLAEAAPYEFIEAVERALRQSPSPFNELFCQESSGVFGRNYLTGLLWALETLAWEEEFLIGVAVILAELALLDPGGNWANRPVNSLATIFMPWRPQTLASISKRRVAIQTIKKDFPEVAWELLLSLLPSQRQVSFGSHKPLWRLDDVENLPQETTTEDYWEQISLYAHEIVEMAECDVAKLSTLISHLANLPKKEFEEVLKLLSSEEITSLEEEQRFDLWSELVGFCYKHTRFSDSEWALDPQIVSEIAGVAEAIAPKNPLYLHRILFNEGDINQFPEIGDWRVQQERLAERRKQAVLEIFNLGGIDALIKFVGLVEAPFGVGMCIGLLAESLEGWQESSILPAFLEADNGQLQLGRGYVTGKHQAEGWAWVDSIDTDCWSHRQIGIFLACLPFDLKTWNRAAALLGTDEVEYWSRASVNPFQASGDLSVAIDKLVEFGRVGGAVDCLYRHVFEQGHLDGAKIVKVLTAPLSSGESPSSMERYYVVELIKALQDDPSSDQDGLHLLEWLYMPLLDRQQGAWPKLLERRLSEESGFLCEVIRTVYRSKDEAKDEREGSAQEKFFVENAWRLLRGWQTPPGVLSDDGFSDSDFWLWLEATKATCSESGHLEVALKEIGRVLVYCPGDPDGLWIHRAAAEALNANDAEKMREGFISELFDTRGVHWVDPSGKPERELAAKYKQQAETVENAGYQRLAAALRELSDYYGRQGEAE